MMKNKLDYAPYYIEAKKKIDEAHELLKKNRYVEAKTLIDEAVVELRMMRAAVKSHVE